MSNSITGKVLSIGKPVAMQGRNNKSFTKREVIIDCTRFDPYTGERSKFENTPLLEFVGDITAELDNVAVGEVVTIYFDVVGSRYTGQGNVEKIFTNLRPYRLEHHSRTATPPEPEQPAPPTFPPSPAQQPSLFGEPSEQLPF